MSKWEMVKLGDVATIVTGSTPSTQKQEYYISEDIPFYKPNDIGENYITELEESTAYISENARKISRILPKNTILVTCIGSIGKVGIALNECTTNQQINAILPHEKLFISKYIAYVLLSKRNYMQNIANAPVVPIINKTEFSRIIIPLPLIEIQEKIAHTLDTVSDLIKMYKEQLEQLDLLVKSQFVEMFGDTVTNSKKLKKTYLGELSELITKGASPNWQGIDYVEDETQTLFVTSENVREGYLDFDKKKYLQDEFNQKQKRSVLKKGDFLINIVGASIGRVAQFNLDVKANINQAVSLVRIKQGILNSDYLLSYLNSPKALKMYESMQVSVARANLSLQNINDLEILTPPIDLQNQFADFATKVEEQKSEVKKALKQAETMYNALMQEYFEG